MRMKPNRLINALRLAYPNIYHRRGHLLANGLLTTGNEHWKNGELEFSYPSPDFNKALKVVDSGVEIDWDEVRRKTARDFADYEVGSVPPGKPRKKRDKSQAERDETYRDMLDEYNSTPEWPRSFDLPYASPPNDILQYPIITIPDDITDEWLAVCVEFLQAAMASRTDYTCDTILTPRQLQERDEWWQKYGDPKRRKQIDAIANQILDELGIPAAPEDKDRVIDKITRAQWNYEYHNAGHDAARANSNNKLAQKNAQIIVADLRRRFPDRMAKLWPVQE